MPVDKEGLPVIEHPEREQALHDAIKVIDDYSSELMRKMDGETNSWTHPVIGALLEARNRINALTEWYIQVNESLRKEQNL